MPERVSSWAAGARTRIRALGALFDAHPHAMVFGAALVLRLAAVLWLNHTPYDQGGDAPHYLSIARDLVEGRSYGFSSGDTTRVPLYQVFLALHLWLFGEALIVVAVTQALLGAATAVILTGTAQELAPSPRAWIAGLLWAVYPPSILNTVVLFTQPLQVLFLTLAFWLVFAGIRRRSTTRCALAAVCWGAACLTRSGNLFFLPVLAMAPLLCWRLRGGGGLRWALRTGLVMFIVGASSVLSWTARDFTTTYRLEHLFLDRHERRAAALILAPLEPVHGRIAARLALWAGSAHAVMVVDPLPMATPIEPGPLAVPPPVDLAQTRRHWSRELDRTSIKLWQAFHAPDGLVQMQCRGPEAGYWSWFRSEFPSRPVPVLWQAISEGCLALKSMMYVQHYVLLALCIPAAVLLVRHLPGVGVVLGAYTAYTLAIIVLGSNYDDVLAAVPRFAFSLMTVPVLLVGLLLGWWTRAGARPESLP